MKEVKLGKRGYSTRKVRILSKLRGIEGLPSVQEEIIHVRIPEYKHYNHWKDIESALLEAERKKAEAINWQRRHFIC